MKTASVIARSLSLVWQSSPRLTLLMGLCVIVRAVLPLVVLYTMGVLVDATLDAYSTFKASLPDGLTLIAKSLAMFGVTMFANYAMRSLSDLLSGELGEKIRANVARRTHAQMSRLSYQTMQSPMFQTEAFRAISGSTERPVRIFLSAIGLVQSVLTFCILGVWMCGVAWWLPLLAMMAGAPTLASRIVASRRSFELRKAQTVGERKLLYYNRVLTNHIYAPEIRLFGIARFFETAFDNVRRRLADTRKEQNRRSATTEVLASAVSTVVMLAVFVSVIILLSTDDGGSIGQLAMCLMTVRRADSAVSDAAQRTVGLHSQSLYVRSLMEFLAMKGDSENRTKRFPSTFNALNVSNVCFSYPESGRHALSGVSMSICRGEVVGIAGSNGSGKSTLAMMLCGLLRPDSGSVDIDGVSLADISPDEISAHVTAVFQDFRIYCAKARENIHFGNFASQPDDDRMRGAARQADIDALLASLPDGYATELGGEFPGSEMFSRGEWQRLAMARALYSRADIFILDEAASALDPSARRVMHDTIRHLRKEGKTVILISHSAETLSVADRVYRLVGGRL